MSTLILYLLNLVFIFKVCVYFVVVSFGHPVLCLTTFGILKVWQLVSKAVVKVFIYLVPKYCGLARDLLLRQLSGMNRRRFLNYCRKIKRIYWRVVLAIIKSWIRVQLFVIDVQKYIRTRVVYDVEEWIRELIDAPQGFQLNVMTVKRNRETLRVLEIGAGVANLSEYPPGTHLTVMDINMKMKTELEEAIKWRPNITSFEFIHDDCQIMKDIPNESFDVVVEAIVMCTRSLDSDVAFRQIHRVLKPGGLFFFTERVNYPNGTVMNKWHRICYEVIRNNGHTCRCDVQDADLMKQRMETTGFEFEYCEYEVYSIWRSPQKLMSLPFVPRYLFGLAVKPINGSA